MNPVTRREMFLDALCDGEVCGLEPVTREEMMLKELTENAGVSGEGGGVSSWNDLTDKPFENTQVKEHVVLYGSSWGEMPFEETSDGSGIYTSGIGSTVWRGVGIKEGYELYVTIDGDERINDLFFGGKNSFGHYVYYAGNPALVPGAVPNTSAETNQQRLKDVLYVVSFGEGAPTVITLDIYSREITAGDHSVEVFAEGYKSVEVICPDNLPKAASVPDVTAAPTAEEFNALLASLRNAGYLAT